MPDQPAERSCLCGSTEDVHLYAGGWRCKNHTPSRQAGRPEPGEGRYCAPARCYCGGCESYGKRMVSLDWAGTTVVDIRAVASGKAPRAAA